MNIPWRENRHEAVSTLAKAKQTSQLDTQKLLLWIEMRLRYYVYTCKPREQEKDHVQVDEESVSEFQLTEMVRAAPEPGENSV